MDIILVKLPEIFLPGGDLPIRVEAKEGNTSIVVTSGGLVDLEDEACEDGLCLGHGPL